MLIIMERKQPTRSSFQKWNIPVILRFIEKRRGQETMKKLFEYNLQFKDWQQQFLTIQIKANGSEKKEFFKLWFNFKIGPFNILLDDDWCCCKN